MRQFKLLKRRERDAIPALSLTKDETEKLKLLLRQRGMMVVVPYASPSNVYRLTGRLMFRGLFDRKSWETLYVEIQHSRWIPFWKEWVPVTHLIEVYHEEN